MGVIKQLIELVYYYREDTVHGKPYWKDPAVIGLVVALLSTELAKFAGIRIDADLQLKIVGSLTGIGALFSPHTGVKKLSGGDGDQIGLGAVGKAKVDSGIDLTHFSP
jgi:hypothetical protein